MSLASVSAQVVAFSSAEILTLLPKSSGISRVYIQHASQKIHGHTPASIWGFLVEASSGLSVAPVLKATGAFVIDPGVVAAEGSRRFAYKESPVPRAGVEEFDMIVCCPQMRDCNDAYESCQRLQPCHHVSYGELEYLIKLSFRALSEGDQTNVPKLGLTSPALALEF
jgi:hypothetical protein